MMKDLLIRCPVWQLDGLGQRRKDMAAFMVLFEPVEERAYVENEIIRLTVKCILRQDSNIWVWSSSKLFSYELQVSVDWRKVTRHRRVGEILLQAWAVPEKLGTSEARRHSLNFTARKSWLSF